MGKSSTQPMVALIGALVVCPACVVSGDVKITKQPEGARVKIGDTARFSVVTDPGNAQVRWYKLESSPSLASGHTFAITNVSGTNAGYYYCLVGASGEVSSDPVPLEVYGENKDEVPGQLTGGIPVYSPYPGAGARATGPCGNYVAMVTVSNPSSTNGVWKPANNLFRTISVVDRTSTDPTYKSTVSIIQDYPPKRFCGPGTGFSADLSPGAKCKIEVYLVDPIGFSGSSILTDVEWRLTNK